MFLFGILTGIGLLIEILLADNGDLRTQDFLIISSIGGFAWLCVVFGILFFVLKRNCNDNYRLEKSHREILEFLENHSYRKINR
ncbi:MAG TPA: hypothetical protein ENH82_17355 [bacterium]|nr:hypothetical protein [bacterium]